MELLLTLWCGACGTKLGRALQATMEKTETVPNLLNREMPSQPFRKEKKNEKINWKCFQSSTMPEKASPERSQRSNYSLQSMLLLSVLLMNIHKASSFAAPGLPAVEIAAW